MIDIDIVFVVLTFGCCLFVVQTLMEYNKRESVMRPQIKEVLDIKERHKEELEKIQRLMDDAEKEASKYKDEITELDTKHGELEVKVIELRAKTKLDDDWKR